MHEPSTEPRTHTTIPAPAERERRRCPRVPVSEVYVTLEAPGLAHQAWVVSALDVSPDGLGLSLPPQLRPGRRVELTFDLGRERFERLPAVLVRCRAGAGGVELGELAAAERDRLAAALS